MRGRSLPPARWLRFGLLATVLLLGACGVSGTATPDLATSRVVPTESPPATPSPTLTEPPGQVLLLLGQEGKDPVAGVLEGELARLAEGSGLEFSSLTPADLDELPANLIAVVTYRGSTELFERLHAAGVERARLLAIAPEGSISAENTAIVGPDGLRTDRAAFLAGYTAAVLSDNYRVAVVSAEGVTPPGSATAFLNGARYYCGLCRAAYPPFADYPASVRLSGAPDDNDAVAVTQRMDELAVRSVYLAPGLENGPLLGALAQAGVQMLGQARPEGIPDETWIASIRPAPELALENVWPELTRGESRGSVPMPLAVTERNRERFSDARYRLVEEVLRDLVAGYIGTGVSTP